jgi:alpha-methylacyl-CoA racemase
MGGALEGIRIVEFVGIGPAPFAGMMLADMGAEVIRIDHPRSRKPVPDPITGRGRPTVAADLKDPADLAGVRVLIDGADALIEGFRPGVLERLGLGPDLLLQSNPRLVVARMTGWGQDGPASQRAGHDINYISVTGALAAIGPTERPVPPLNLVGDYGGGALYLVAGLLAALIAAGRTGRGQVVDVAMCDGALSLLSFFFEMAAIGTLKMQRESNMLDGGAPYYGVYRCADGLDVAIGAIEPQFRAALCAGLELDPAEFGGPDAPDRWPDQRAKIAAAIAARPRAEWCAIFEDTDACLTPVLTMEEVASHPHLRARSAMVDAGGLLQPAPAPRFSVTPSAIRSKREGNVALADMVEQWHAR